MAQNPPVIDLSHWNPTPDWRALYLGGTVGVIHKATEGETYVDPTLFGRARAAMDAGIKWATYHFLRPGSMKAQMDHYLVTLQPRLGERVCLDHEDAGVSLDDLVDAVEYLRAVRPDLQITIYSGNVIKEQLGNAKNDVLAAQTSLWLAQYTTGSPSWPTATWPAWSLWQYTDRATVQGVSQPVDGNNWNGSANALLEWFGPAGEQPAPGPTPPEPEPKVQVFLVEPGTTEIRLVLPYPAG